MTFISYAQNYEDVMLRRALKSVEKGFYVDVGAQHPVNDSVTKAFYEEGWSGINIEPVPHWHDEIVKGRPRDTNLNVALGNKPGVLTIYSVAETGLSTADPEYAERYRSEGREVSALEVQVRTLTDVLDEFAPGEIHFLKIDVEGFEQQVIDGFDMDRHRPWILVIESTQPNSTEERFDWEPLVIHSGYHFVYFDGLNRFYVAAEHREIDSLLATPPNVFDNYIRYSEWIWKQEADKNLQYTVQLSGHACALEERAEKAEIALGETWGRLEKTQVALNASRDALRETLSALTATREEVVELKKIDEQSRFLLGKEVKHLQGELHGIYASRSWRVTRPLRAARFVASKLAAWLVLLARSPLSGTKVAVRKIFRLLAAVPAIRRLVVLVISRLPGIKRRLTRFILGKVAKDSGVQRPLSRSAAVFILQYKAALAAKQIDRGAQQ